MPTVQPSAHDLANRRMVVGLLLSLLAHALILSIGFGLSGMRAGGAGPVTVSLAPLPPPAARPEALPAPADAAPAAASTAAPVPAPVPASGFRLFDPVPMAPPPPSPQAQARPARRRKPVRVRKPPARESASTPVIVQQDNPDAAFKVPLADVPVEPVPEAPEPVKAESEAAEPDPDLLAAEEAAQRAREEAERQRLVEEERAQAEQEQTRLRDEAAARERLLASEREAEAETRRLQEEQLRQERDRQERVAQEAARARELAAQRALAEREAREAAVREASRVAAEEEARRLAADRERAALQLAEETARQRAAEAARQRARQLARQQEEDERARGQRAEQAAAQAAQEELARQQAVQQARRQAAQAEGARQAAQGIGAADMPAGAPGNGAGVAGGTVPRGGLDGAGLASRARELLRGIELPAPPPAALRPAQQMAQGRRRVVDTLERDVSLRLYVDSFRQKIERNAAQIRMQVAGGPGRADPLVSVALRSDGSVDDVTIVRSSGRADLDEAVRRIVRLNARYAAFPPTVAARFDVIEIRRIWLFAETLKLLEEVR